MNKEDYKKLVVAVTAAQHAYHTLDEPVISDQEYDQLIQQLAQVEKEHPDWINGTSVLDRVGGEIKRGLYPVKHEPPMRSLDNVFSVAELQNFMAKWGEKYNIHISLKDDGLACSLLYHNRRLVEAATRGDGEMGESILHNVIGYPSIPRSLPNGMPSVVKVRGELVMFDDEFIAYNERLTAMGLKPAVNPRNAAAGIARRLSNAKLPGATLVFIPYGMVTEDEEGKMSFSGHEECLATLVQCGFELQWPVGVLPGNVTTDRLLELVDKYLQARVAIPFGIDGMVFRVDDLARCKELGYTARAPRFAVAYKFPPEEKVSTVREIRLQIGRTGNATPVAILDPVVVGGVTVTNATLHNEDQIKRLGVAVGDKVIIRRAGDVVPEIARVYHKGRDRTEWEFPKECTCGTELVKSPDVANHYCPNVQCPQRIQRAFEHFVSRKAMDIDGIGEELISKLLGAGKIKWFDDLYDLTVEDILEVTSETSGLLARSVIESISRSRATTVRRFINALGIPMVGEGTAKRLHEYFGSLEVIMAAGPILLRAVPDIGAKVAESLINFGNGREVRSGRFEKLEKGLVFTDTMGPCADFGKFEDIMELIYLSDIKGVTPKNADKYRRWFTNYQYPHTSSVFFPLTEKEKEQAEAFMEANSKLLDDVAEEWETVVDYIGDVRQIEGNQPLDGQTYVITGNFDGLGSRNELSATLTGLGAKVTGSVSKNTTALFQGDEPGKNKVDAAVKLGLPILTYKDLHELLSKHSK